MAMEKSEGQTRKVTKRKASARTRQLEDSSNQLGDGHDIIALKERISRLEAENKDLRRQIAAMANSANLSNQSGRDPVSEQRHNFFKYSNIRRY
jgi:hypothetical protein